MHWKHDTWHIDTGPGPLSCSKQNIHKIHWWQTINVKMKSQETKRCTLHCKWSQPVHYNAMLILLSVRGAAQGPSPHRLGTGLMRIIQRKQGSCCPATACRVPGCPHRCLEPGVWEDIILTLTCAHDASWSCPLLDLWLQVFPSIRCVSI